MRSVVTKERRAEYQARYREKNRARIIVQGLPVAALCQDCGQTKPASEFDLARSRRTGLDAYCKPCKQTRQKGRLPAAIIDPYVHTTVKACSACHQHLPSLAFSLSRHSSGGLNNVCRACCKGRTCTSHLKNRDALRSLDPLLFDLRQRRNTARYRDRKKGLHTCSLEEWVETAKRPCYSCGWLPKSGFNSLDRIDGSIGHTATNTLPACQPCNTVRMDIFTPEEMRLVFGPAIASRRESRIRDLGIDPIKYEGPDPLML